MLSACVLTFSVTAFIMWDPQETDQQIGSHNIFSSQTRCAGSGIMSLLHTAELFVYRRTKHLRSGPVLHRLLSVPAEVGSQDVPRLQVAESSFFFITLPPSCIFKGSIPILEEAFTKGHGGYVGSLKMSNFILTVKRNGPAFANPFSTSVCQNTLPIHSTATASALFLHWPNLRYWPFLATMSDSYMDPNRFQWPSESD